MTAKPDGDMNQHNGDQNNAVISDKFPGGEQQQPPVEPQLTEGCTTSTATDTDNNDTRMQTIPKDGQQKITKYLKPIEEIDDSASPNSNNKSPKRQKMDDDEEEDEHNKRANSKTSVQSVSDREGNENNPNQRRSGAVTRSLASLPKLRVTFDNSDDDDSSYSSWAQQDIAEYRNNYPNTRSNSTITDNYDFYTNKISSHPDGDLIDNIHKKWSGDYRKLEYHHGYIQWLFPLQEKGLNWSAEPLQKHEIESIKKNPKALERILKSYKLMLDFYGFELFNKETGEIRRLSGDAYKERFRNLNTSSHNYLRITRILKCLGEFDYEYLKFPFLEAILRESITENTLPNCLRSCKDYWIETLRSQAERRAIRQYARELIEYRNKEIRPPPSHRATRPTSTSATKQIEKMSISNNDDGDNNNSNQ